MHVNLDNRLMSSIKILINMSDYLGAGLLPAAPFYFLGLLPGFFFFSSVSVLVCLRGILSLA